MKFSLMTGGCYGVLSKMMHILVSVILLLTGGVWGVLCESPTHTAIESISRDCCSKTCSDETLKHCLSEKDDDCFSCEPHSCRDTPLVISADRPEKKSDGTICMCSKCRLHLDGTAPMSKCDSASNVTYAAIAPERANPRVLSTVLLI